MNIQVTTDDLSDGAIAKLLNEHLQEMGQYSPPESIHAIDVARPKDLSVTFWAARIGGQLAGCGALKELPSGAGEVKSMKTNNAYVRRGIATKILVEIIAEAERRSYTKIVNGVKSCILYC